MKKNIKQTLFCELLIYSSFHLWIKKYKHIAKTNCVSKRAKTIKINPKFEAMKNVAPNLQMYIVGIHCPVSKNLYFFHLNCAI